jgi:hypothetical protein
MKVERSWLITSAFWAYLIIAIILYGYLKVAWVNNIYFLLGFAPFLAILVWYVIAGFDIATRRGQKKSDWVLGPYGDLRRREPQRCQSQNLPTSEMESNARK